jgi:hypothetical protein
VVDGQQRITTLVGVLGSSDTVDPLFEVCFDLRRARFVHAGRPPLPSWWLPLRVTLVSRTLLSWLRENGESLSADELDVADALGGVLRDYRVPAYVVEGDDEELLRDVFDRVNSAGHPITRAQVFHALFGGDTQAATTEAVITALRREKFGDFDAQRVVQSLLAIRGGDVARDLHSEFEANEDVDPWFDAVEQALSRVIAFFRRQGVPHLQLVPSTLPVPVLAAYFHLHPDPEPWNERLLARWLWRGWVHGYGRAGQTPALRQAVRAVNPKKDDPQGAPSEYDAVRELLGGVPDEPLPDILSQKFRTDSVTGRLGLLALASLGPRRANGELIDPAEEFEAHGVKAVTEFVRGHRSELAARGLWPVGEKLPSGREGSDVLISHAISGEGA